MTTNNIKPFDYQQASFFVGLELAFKRPYRHIPEGQRAFVYAVTDYGMGCVLDVRLTSQQTKRLAYFDKTKFFKLFQPVQFYP